MINVIIKQLLQLFSFGHFLFRSRRLPNSICLTFDDGPSLEYTGKLLDILKQNNIKAIFFLIGNNVERYPDLARRILDEGHQIGGHTYSHTEIPSMSPRQAIDDLFTTRNIFKKKLKHDSVLFRPPRGRLNIRNTLCILFNGYKIVHWSVTYSDYLKDGSDQLNQRISRRPPRSGDIILLHDNNQHTLESLPFLVDQCNQRKLSFTTIL